MHSPALAVVCALVLTLAVACGGEDDPTATTAPAAQPTNTSAPDPTAEHADHPTATSAPAPTATATTAAAPAATATSGSSGQDYGEDYGESTQEATEAPMTEPTATDAPAAGQNFTVPIQGFSFLPIELTVPVGSTVTWTNMDSAPHTATADDGSFNTGLLNQGDSASVTFDTPGTYTYYCALHPSMTATIIVTN